MFALSSDRLGAADTYALRVIPEPEPAACEVLLRIEATALGYVDPLIAAGRYQHRPPPPYVPGAEIIGTIVRCGSAITDWSVGDRVASWQLLAGGGLAELAVAPAASLISVPEALPSDQAASLLLDFLTAHYALFDRAHCRTGESVLVLGASGGVGSAAVRLAANAGAHVIAAASTPQKRAFAAQAGAHAVIDYSASDWRHRLLELSPAGVDVVVDPVGGDMLEPAFRSLAKGGRYLVLGFAGGAVPALPVNLPLLKNAALVGVDARHLFETDRRRAVEIWSEVFSQALKGRIPPRVLQPFRLEFANRALSAVTRRDHLGKIVMTMDGGI